MSASDEFMPFQEGPLFPEDDESLASEAATFLGAYNYETTAAVAKQNIHDQANDSFNRWLIRKLKEAGIDTDQQ